MTAAPWLALAVGVLGALGSAFAGSYADRLVSSNGARLGTL